MTHSFWIVVFMATLSIFGICSLGCDDHQRETNFKPGTTFAIHDFAVTVDQKPHELSAVASNLIEPPLLTESDVRSAVVVVDERGTVCLQITVNVLGVEKLSAATSTPGTQIAFVINGAVVSAPIVSSRISQRCLISNSFNQSD